MAPKFRRKRCVLCCSIIIVSSVAIYSFIKTKYPDISISLNESCVASLPRNFKSQLCTNYTNEIAHGNLCLPLCKSKTVKNTGCLHHGDTVVIFAIWDGREVAIKWKKPHYDQHLTLDYLRDMFVMPTNSKLDVRDVWKQLLLSQLESVLGPEIYKLTADATNSALENMDASFTTDPAVLRSFVPLLGQDEFAMLGYFQELKHFPKIHGYCGQTYAVEKLTPYSSYFPAVIRNLEWKTRVKLGLGFLDLMQELEHTKIGPLHHCDIQEGNFGVTDDFEVKVIDVDMIFTDVRMKEILVQPKCSRDSDCEFFDCVSMCDLKNRKCLARKITNNFQVLCRDIFKSSWQASGLFGRIPSRVSPILSTLLNDCSSKRFGYLPPNHRRIKSTIRTMKLVLSKELQMEKKTRRLKDLG